VIEGAHGSSGCEHDLVNMRLKPVTIKVTDVHRGVAFSGGPGLVQTVAERRRLRPRRLSGRQFHPLRRES
jgi:hypothetical protein